MHLLNDVWEIAIDLRALVNTEGAAKLLADIRKLIADFRSGTPTT